MRMCYLDIKRMLEVSFIYFVLKQPEAINAALSWSPETEAKTKTDCSLYERSKAYSP